MPKRTSYIPNEIGNKIFRLHAMMWISRLLSSTQAQQTISVVGPPVKRDGLAERDQKPIRTITVSIAYKPTSVAGDANYALMGCYGHSNLDGLGGHPFGTASDFASPPSVDAKDLTVFSCLEGCSGLHPPNGQADGFKYAGLKNGSECFCGLELASAAEKLDSQNCSVPCSGNGKLSCGGVDNTAVYSHIPDQKKIVAPSTIPAATSASGASSNLPVHAIITPTISDSASEPDADPTGASSGATVAAVTGSLSGIALLVGLVFFFLRWQKAKKSTQEAHVNAMLAHHRDNTALKQQQPLGFTATNSDVHNDIHLTIDANLVPSTPVIEKGATSFTNFSSSKFGGRGYGDDENRNSLYSTLMHEVQAPPKIPNEGNSSAVQWRTIDHTGEGTPLSPRIASPPPSALFQGRGDRSWPRRRLSTPDGPPAALLPPNPPSSLSSGIHRGGGGIHPIRLPRRSSLATFESVDDSPVDSPSAMSFGTASSEGVKPTPPLKLRRLGAEPALNIQTGHDMRAPRNLTAVQGRPPPPQARQPSVPTLPAVKRAETMNFDSPVLPPVEAGTRFNFDSTRWKDLPGTPAEARVPLAKAVEHHREQERRRWVNEDGVSPASATTIGTSILDSPTIMDWAMR